MTDKPTPTDAELQSIIDDADAGPPTDKEWLCLECGRWTPWRHEEAHDHADGCKAPAIYAAKRDWKTRLKDYMAKWGIPAGAGEPDAVAYLDIGTGYLDLGTELSEEALLRLPKGRHVLVIAGTYGIDGYAPTPQPTQAQPVAREPLTHAQAKALVSKYGNDPLHLVYQVEAAHGIKGGQHGT